MDGKLVRRTQVIVDHLTTDNSRLLTGVEPLLHTKPEVVLRGPRTFQLGVQDPLHPVGVGRARPVHADGEVEHDIFSFQGISNQVAFQPRIYTSLSGRIIYLKLVYVK